MNITPENTWDQYTPNAQILVKSSWERSIEPVEIETPTNFIMLEDIMEEQMWMMWDYPMEDIRWIETPEEYYDNEYMEYDTNNDNPNGNKIMEDYEELEKMMEKNNN